MADAEQYRVTFASSAAVLEFNPESVILTSDGGATNVCILYKKEKRSQVHSIRVMHEWLEGVQGAKLQAGCMTWYCLHLTE